MTNNLTPEFFLMFPFLCWGEGGGSGRARGVGAILVSYVTH